MLASGEKNPFWAVQDFWRSTASGHWGKLRSRHVQFFSHIGVYEEQAGVDFSRHPLTKLKIRYFLSSCVQFPLHPHFTNKAQTTPTSQEKKQKAKPKVDNNK